MDFTRKYDPGESTALTVPPGTLEAIAEAVAGCPLRSSSRLSGGFSNANFLLVFADGERCVLRVARDPARLTIEADILVHVLAVAPSVPVPHVLWRSDTPIPGGLGAFAMTFVDARPLSEVEDTLSDIDCRAVCEDLAVAAAAIHAITFPQSGMLGPGPVVDDPFDSYAGGAAAFLRACLDNQDLQRRTGPERLIRLRRCMTRRADLQVPPGDRQLCHSDFNQKNLLVRSMRGGRPRLAAVIDWEFAFVGSGVIDIGNLLRFEAESPSVDPGWFADAYRDAGGQLDAAWREQALFADLLAQCAFLVRGQELPKTFATALGVIDRTLAVLDP